jgi:hypothetical protein
MFRRSPITGLFPDGIYNFYNVLKIKWEGGIAYPEALGRVKNLRGKPPTLKELT